MVLLPSISVCHFFSSIPMTGIRHDCSFPSTDSRPFLVCRSPSPLFFPLHSMKGHQTFCYNSDNKIEKQRCSLKQFLFLSISLFHRQPFWFSSLCERVNRNYRPKIVQVVRVTISCFVSANLFFVNIQDLFLSFWYFWITALSLFSLISPLLYFCLWNSLFIVASKGLTLKLQDV